MNDKLFTIEDSFPWTKSAPSIVNCGTKYMYGFSLLTILRFKNFSGTL